MIFMMKQRRNKNFVNKRKPLSEWCCTIFLLFYHFDVRPCSVCFTVYGCVSRLDCKC
eukprot:UN11647